ncbi:MAG: hypothetical protein JJE08_03435 [Proteiniphilum sp.]|nr:hypothetical protein [Proteiniphilum sp.]
MKRDSLKTDIATPLPGQPDSVESVGLPLKFLRLNPAENLQPQFTPYDRHTVSPQPGNRSSGLPAVHWSGAASDYFNSKSRTAVAATMPTSNLLLYSSATLGLVETPWFGKGNYYILNAGANYAVSPLLNMGVSGGYNSNFGTLPFWNAGVNASLMLHPNLMIDGGITYMSTASNMFNMNQSAVMVDMHSRYRISDDWYLNGYGGMPVLQSSNHPTRPMMPMMNTPYYGGSVEHWFKPTMGVEAGMIWMRDMFSGKMRPQPKLELLFRPGR